MALPVLPNPSNFLAVALVINRSRDGPRFVFHYPPRVSPTRRGRAEPDDGNDLDDDDDALLKHAAQLSGLGAAGPSAPTPAELLQWNQDDHLVTESGSQIVPWEHVAGFPTRDLGMILTPARSYHKRLFQISLDPLYCVSYPIYVPESGTWKRRTRKKRKSSRSAKRDDDVGPTDTEGTGAQSGELVPPDGDLPEANNDAAPKSAAPGHEEGGDKKSSMTMFNLVFILHPKRHEAKDLVDVMFVHIIKKVNKALKYCQQRSDFVWKESKKILALKDKGREDKTKMSVLWDEILSTSSLAASMQDIYDAVSQNKIAALQLDTPAGTVTHSVQIPIPFYVPDLPQEGEGDPQGLWITTANTFASDEAAEGAGYLDKNFALLLMDDEKRITAELQTDPDETTLSMVEFVRHCKATLSLYQVAQQASNILEPAQVRKYAQHFIYWRRAIAIPPLHARDIYILSPNCNMSRLPQAAAQWARQFPLAPALPNLLADLSVAPRPYKTLCPSKPYRPLYMAMLAWLMRGGWVTQLCTFAYVVVWPEIIYEVEYALEAEEIAKAKRAQNHGSGGGSLSAVGGLASPKRAGAAGNSLAGEGDGDGTAGGSSATGHHSEDLESSTATLRGLSLAPSSTATTPVTKSIPDISAYGGDSGSAAPPASPVSPSHHHGHQHHHRHLRHLRHRSSTDDNNDASDSRHSHGSDGGSDGDADDSEGSGSAGDEHSEGDDDDNGNEGHGGRHDRRRRRRHRHPRSHLDDEEPTPAEQAAEKARLERIADKAARDLADRATAHARKAPPRATAHPSVNDAPHLRGMAPHVVLDAKKATGKESLYLDAIGRRLPRKRWAEQQQQQQKQQEDKEKEQESARGAGKAGDEDRGGGDGQGKESKRERGDSRPALGAGGVEPGAQSEGVGGGGGGGARGRKGGGAGASKHGARDWDERAAAAWPMFWKYFNGRSALERIALQEDMKRKDVWNILTAMSEYLLCVRHW